MELKVINEKGEAQKSVDASETLFGRGEEEGPLLADAVRELLADAGAGSKPWRAFLSATADETGKPVHAIDRIVERGMDRRELAAASSWEPGKSWSPLLTGKARARGMTSTSSAQSRRPSTCRARRARRRWRPRSDDIRVTEVPFGAGGPTDAAAAIGGGAPRDLVQLQARGGLPPGAAGAGGRMMSQAKQGIRLPGSIVPPLTPFTADLKVDYDALHRMVDYVVEDCDAAMVIAAASISPCGVTARQLCSVSNAPGLLTAE